MPALPIIEEKTGSAISPVEQLVRHNDVAWFVLLLKVAASADADEVFYAEHLENRRCWRAGSALLG